MGGAEHRETAAARWAAWARALGHDAYWYCRDAFFALMPPPGRATLEVGGGEGRVARDPADDMRAVVRETARALGPGGRLCVCVTHPLVGAGRFTARAPGAPFVIETSYLAHRPYAGTFERDGLRVSFGGWCYPLGAYAQALEAAGFLVEALREPEPARDAPSRLGRYRRIPSFLMLRALKTTAHPAVPLDRPRATGERAPS